MRNKICLLTDSLSSGGAEKMVSNLSISLTNNRYEVVIVSMLDQIEYPFLGELYNFGKIKKANNKLNAFLKFLRFIKSQNFDIIIDHRVRNLFLKEIIFSKFVFKNLKVIYCVHHFNLSLYFPLLHLPWLSRISMVKDKKIVSVSKVIKHDVKRKLNLKSDVVYNYTILEIKKKFELNEFVDKEYIIAVGRLEKVKQFDVLIRCYKKSILPQNEIKLLIFGEGQERIYLRNLIQELHLESLVSLMGFNNNVSAFIKNAKALVVSSDSEGFPMVLIEALALKTPMISFDCKSGPNEIIIHEENGLLVEDQNYEELINALNKMISNKAFYMKLKNNLLNDNNKFKEDLILTQWVQILEDFSNTN